MHIEITPETVVGAIAWTAAMVYLVRAGLADRRRYAHRR